MQSKKIEDITEKKFKNQNKNLTENPDFGAKPDPRRNLSGKNFASGNSPLHVESKYILFKKSQRHENIIFCLFCMYVYDVL